MLLKAKFLLKGGKRSRKQKALLINFLNLFIFSIFDIYIIIMFSYLQSE